MHCLRLLSVATLLPTLVAVPRAQDAQLFRGAPGLLSLPVGNPFGLDMVAKAAGTDAAAPVVPNGSVDFRSASILAGVPVQIDGLSVGLDWVIADADGQIPPARQSPSGWSWAAMLLSVSRTAPSLSVYEDPNIRTERARSDGAGGDLFALTLKGSLLPGLPLPTTSHRIDLAVDSPEISIYAGTPSELDGYDLYGAFYLQDALAAFLPQPPTIYFTLTSASVNAVPQPPTWKIGPGEWSGATIFKALWNPVARAWTGHQVYRSPASLGLAPQDDIDALAVDTIHLWDHGGEDYLLFSLVPSLSLQPGPGAGVGISFARSGSTGRRVYRDQGGADVDGVIGYGTNIDALCLLDPGRDAVLRRAMAMPRAAVPGFPLQGTSQVWLTRSPFPTGSEVLRTVLWSPNCPLNTSTPAPELGVGVLSPPGTFLPLFSFVVATTARMRSSGSLRLQGCPATFDFPLPPGFDLAGLDLDFYLANVNATSLAVTTPPPKGEDACAAGLALAEGSTAGALGALAVESVTTATAGTPIPQGMAVAFQPITHSGSRGYRELVSAGVASGSAQADIDIDRQDRVCQDLRNPSAPHISLPNGGDLYVCRDASAPASFFLAVLERATGAFTRLSGSTFTDSSGSPTAASVFRSQFAFSRDGRTGVCVVTDSSNLPTPNRGVPDRILLFKTSPAETFPGTNRNAFDASPPYVQPTLLHTAYNGSLRIGANGFGLVEGEEPSGNTGAAALWGGPTDGSAPWSFIPVPNTGSNRPFYWSYSSWRQSADGTVDVFLNGSDSSNSTTEMDVMAITSLGGGPPSVVNLTQFVQPTQIQTFGNSTLGTANLRGALSPGGGAFAFVTGGNSPASPGALYLVPTNGSASPYPISQGRFGSQVVTFAELWWLTDRFLLFSASTSTSSNDDLYVFDTQSFFIHNLTNRNDLVIRGSFLAENGTGYYFLRGYASTALGIGTDWKRLDIGSLPTAQITDITGNEFSSGTAPSLRGMSLAPQTWFPRRRPNGELVFVAGRNQLVYTDDEVFRFDADAGTQAVQVTAFNGGAGSPASVRRIQDLVLSPYGGQAVFSQGIGTTTTAPENLFVLSLAAGAPRQLSRNTTGLAGIADGSVVITQCPPGVAWVQGDGSRTAPVSNSVALWSNLAAPSAPPLRLTAPPTPASKVIHLLGARRLNP